MEYLSGNAQDTFHSDHLILDLQERAGIPYQAPEPIQPALGACERHRRNRKKSCI